ncbi:tripartite tricarboxylate transporter permease [Rhodoplanes sp. TEM]|uniref:Tripartite tricarboxylate transporter permease n=1 Tax=Rhodoplanes tepidamans TaxID=200616 RepID=A0ABT5J985_RHOTP|nr:MULTISPECIES: tripartite tricarboxylate transporter permease [Rhodoplanes]MDC7786131.1 tripartite tricarboxylate transporter permease [Rhodoplanes tepidamans]MDC7982798.1 tripartite tricarboxylate transporter permease [Rhodoplanes sp. TEM]MDQ0357204.1 putative tricarboxylic transport membrane protein [Rhodoplanes tepidamans]
MDIFLTALAASLSWQALLGTFFGALVGLIFGAIPGLTYSMALAMVLPITFSMSHTAAIAMLLGTYIGGMTGGAVSAILIGVPGTPSAAATVLDGEVMAKQGKASIAIGIATIAGCVGGILSLIVMLVSVDALARVAISFGPAEITALVVFGLSTICGLAGGSLVKGLIGGVIGLMLMNIGQDPIDGVPRFTFGTTAMLQGVDLLVAMIGLFAVPHVVTVFATYWRGKEMRIEAGNVRTELPSWRLLLSQRWNFLRSAAIGTVVGAIPGTGGPIAAFLAYDQAKRWSKHPETFGKGEVSGVVAPEASNHAVTGGAMIPLIGLGIPGDPATAIILGGLLIHGIQPGPLLFMEKPDVIMSIYLLFVLAYVVTALIQLFGVRAFVKALRVPPHLMAVGILVMCVIGSFAIRNSLFDVGVMGLVGFVAYWLIKGGIPATPILLGLVLGPTLEREARTAMIMSEGSPAVFVESYTALLFWALALVILGSQLITMMRSRNQGSKKAAA